MKSILEILKQYWIANYVNAIEEFPNWTTSKSMIYDETGFPYLVVDVEVRTPYVNNNEEVFCLIFENGNYLILPNE